MSATLDAAPPSRLPRREAFRLPLARPGLRALALLGSFLAHGAVLAASAIAPAPAPPGSPPLPRTLDYDRYLVHAQDPPGYCDFPPSEHVEACFDRATLDASGHCTDSPYCSIHERLHGHDAHLETSWAPLPALLPTDPPGDGDAVRALLEDNLRECVETARHAGWSGEGSAIIRVFHDADGASGAQVFSDDMANHPGLLCCLRLAQAPSVSVIPRGRMRQYLFKAGPTGIAIIPPMP